MKIYLLKGNQKTFLTQKDTYKECCEFIQQKLKEYHAVSYYSRLQMIEDDAVMIDFGSWSDFFIIKGITWEEVLKGE